jgi:glutamate-ammonia-ligase adenylyltransferase
MLFPVDTRLRPRGVEGELLITPADLARYFQREALAWEALSYAKLRFIAGSRTLGQQAYVTAATLWERFAAEPDFKYRISEMRHKLEASDPEQNFKTSSGAIYDIDFLTGFLLVTQRIHYKNGSLRDRIWRCADAGLLDRRDAALLDHSAELLRTVDHVGRLVVGRRNKWLPTGEQALHSTEKLTSVILRRSFDHGLKTELRRTCVGIRQVYERVLGVPTG